MGIGKGLKESQIKKLIMDDLWWKYRKWSYFWIAQAGGIPNKDNFGRITGFRSSLTKGIADILDSYKGRFTAIEVKRPDGELSQVQRNFLENVVKSGQGFAYVIDDYGRTEEMVAEIEKDIKNNTFPTEIRFKTESIK